MREWINWSGSLRFTPREYVCPESEDALATAIRHGHAAGKKVRLAAAGHSSSPLVATPDVLLHLHHFKGLVSYDAAQRTATFRAGTLVHEANAALQQVGLALFNTGDVDVQTLAGAIATGTHGSGRALQNLASMLQAVRMIDYEGDVRLFSEGEHADAMRALRVSLGALGIFTEITVSVLPLFRLRRLELCTDTESCLEHFDALADENRNVDFYWYPRSDGTKIRVLNEPGRGTASFPANFRCVDDEEGFVGEILPRKRTLKFDEMEYALPRDAGMACFQAVRKRIKDKHRRVVAWRVLYRTIAADQNYLSPHYGRESVSISLHHNAGLPFEAFFNDIEPIFRAHGGRPHWAKKHNLRAADLRGLYPEWNTFQAIRKSFDPEGCFISSHLSELLDPDHDG
ncbi:D-arabinono-1,4-lactone oxidase [Dawidia soli]|uniref:FAD-binding protein n=1 Tax=Dawidia soli TaxID=2782352 RepID=A0AAP2GKC1_9BACT|nr:D-arabinono-1,4-lactone oxidase [Dawidia soli]MBT1690291.1 FAD-binding protein [Dawidia soli]